MKFIVDAQLSRRLAASLRQIGFDAIHTLDLPQGNNTTDSEINKLSISGEYIVITKDSDFVDSFLLRREPWKLLLVSTGNIRNAELETLFLANISKIVDGFESLALLKLIGQM